MSEMLERVALAIATKIHVDAVKNNLGEINQLDKIQEWMNLYPVKVTDSERDLARLAIEIMVIPTREMIDAVDGPWSDDDRPAFLREYGIAINAALKDPS